PDAGWLRPLPDECVGRLCPYRKSRGRDLAPPGAAHRQAPAHRQSVQGTRFRHAVGLAAMRHGLHRTDDGDAERLCRQRCGHHAGVRPGYGADAAVAGHARNSAAGLDPQACRQDSQWFAGAVVRPARLVARPGRRLAALGWSAFHRNGRRLMSTLPAAVAQDCFHCGLPVPAGLQLTVGIDNTTRSMCCAGCQAVAQAIVDNGLTSYYQTREGFPAASGSDALVPEELRLYDDAEVLVRSAGAACG